MNYSYYKSYLTKKYFPIFKDDLVVPYMLGERLYQAALAKRPLDAKPVNFVSFESELGNKNILKPYNCFEVLKVEGMLSLMMSFLLNTLAEL